MHVRFRGSILPKVFRLTVDPIPNILWTEPKSQQDICFKITIVESKFDVCASVDAFEKSMLSPIYMRAIDLVQAATDLVCFQKGWGLQVYPEEFFDPDGNRSELVLMNETLSGVCFFASQQANFSRLLPLVLSNPPLFMALSDLIRSITHAHVGAVNCARAVEGICKILSPNLPKEKAWKRLREALNVERDFVEMITRYSNGPRHGDRVRIEGFTASEIIRRSWIIMDRFLALTATEVASLPLEKYPSLTDTKHE